jgi:two-component system, NtrC family, response regulator AtoC
MATIPVGNGLNGNLPPETVVFGRSEPMQALRANLEKLATASVPMLIEGESGTGKDILAKLIHYKSSWNQGPYVKVNCPAIPGTLMESELFGYEKGSFTGAFGAKPGRVEMADRGTLFLDEISELEIGLQSKLLQFLQDGQFCRIGGEQDTRVEVRVICATNRRLEDEVNKGTFRQDLYYRINVISLRVPPLRQRSGDIPVLVEYFRETFNRKYNCNAKPISDRLMHLMMGYQWPGNIRELENLLKRYVILGAEDTVFSELRPTEVNFPLPEISLDRPISLKAIRRAAVRDVERQVIAKILQANQWNRRRTARALNISYRALLYKLKEAGIPAANESPHKANGNGKA